jgi:hypothetical protein
VSGDGAGMRARVVGGRAGGAVGHEGTLALGANSTYLLHIHEHLGSVVDNGVFPRRPRAGWAFLQRFLKHLCRVACAHADVCERESDSSSTRASVSGPRRLAGCDQGLQPGRRSVPTIAGAVYRARQGGGVQRTP